LGKDEDRDEDRDEDWGTTKIGTRIGIGGSSLKSNYKQPAMAIHIMTLNVAKDRLKPELQTSEYRLQPEALRGRIFRDFRVFRSELIAE
jgi:hypothetical protein